MNIAKNKIYKNGIISFAFGNKRQKNFNINIIFCIFFGTNKLFISAYKYFKLTIFLGNDYICCPKFNKIYVFYKFC